MKKHLALLLTALMICLMAVPVFAGEQREVDVGNVAFGIKRATKPFKPDGVIEEGEYYEVPMKDTWFSYAWNVNDPDAETFSKTMGQKLYMSWDDTYVYTATVYKVSTFFNEYGGDPVSMWMAACIQNNFALKADDVSAPENRLEYGIGLTSDTNELINTVWADQSDGAPYAGWVPEAGTDFTVTHSNNVLTYEVRTPWSAFYGAAPKEGDVFGYCIVWAGGTDYNNYVHAQLASGCTGFGKDAYSFAQVTLEAAPVIETEPPAEEPASQDAPVTTPVAPKTADVFTVVAFAAIATASGAIAVSKKRK